MSRRAWLCAALIALAPSVSVAQSGQSAQNQAPPDTEPFFEPPRFVGLIGLKPPTYDRINGLSLPFAPTVALGARFSVEPRLTYRSNLGRIDPALLATAKLDDDTRLTLRAERTTLTNDAWIFSDLANSAEYLFFGEDARNYYRAVRGTLAVSRSWITKSSSLEPYVGGRWERDRSADRDSSDGSVPWTFFGRHDPQDAHRANPAIDPEDIASAIAGGRFKWTDGSVVVKADLAGEIGKPVGADVAPSCAAGPCSRASFAQLTFDGRIDFPTFGTQSVSVDGHAVATRSDATPRQRFAYVGGAGSIRTLDLLQLGGDELLYLDGRYNIPFARVKLPLVGSPTVTLREILAGAAVGAFPSIEQASGVRVGVSFVYAEILVDPVHRHASGGVGFSIGR